MSGALFLQKVLSGELASRNFFSRPPEPTHELLVSPPGESVYIGKTKLLRTPFFWNPKKLVNPHICVVGITGSGKSYFVKTFITRASIAYGSSALILDWAGEYSDWVRSAGGRVVSFWEGGINLLDLGGTTPHIRTRQVVSALEMLTDLSQFPSQRRLTEAAIEQAYANRGFPLHKANEKRKAPTFEHVLSALRATARKSPDAAEAHRRIKNLLLSSGKSFCHSSIRLSSILSGLVCVDLHALPTEQLRSMAGLAILQFAKEKMRTEKFSAAGLPRLFIVVDEAWKIAADERSDVVSIVREGRKYGFGLVVASQNPTDVHKSIFSNAGSAFCFRLTLASERQYVRSSVSYSEFYESKSHGLSLGQPLVHLEFSQPVKCPKEFIISKVEGEELLAIFSIWGEKMGLEFERGALSRKLLSIGLSDRQVLAIIAEFERCNYSLGASEFVSLLERLGHSRTIAISLLRELGAQEKDLLQLFSHIGKRQERIRQTEALVSLSGAAKAPSVLKKESKRKGVSK